MRIWILPKKLQRKMCLLLYVLSFIGSARAFKGLQNNIHTKMDGKIIEEVQKYRVIYAKNLHINKTADVKENAWKSNASSLNMTQMGEEQKLLVLLNPKSGPGKARDMFQTRVAPLLAEAEFPYDLYVTRHANYARDFVRTKDIYQWRGIVVVGGDGIMFEVINGLFERPDWETALKKIPLGIIPCGSGNGLAKSISHGTEEPYDNNPVLASALNVVNSRSTPMDLVRVETKSQFVFSFLSVGWGLISDIDIESEKLRAIGGQRFTIWSVARLIGLRTYPGKVWYQPVTNLKAPPPRYPGITRSASQSGDESGDTPVHLSKSYHASLAHYSTELSSLNLETLGRGLDEVYGRDDRCDSFYSTIDGEKIRTDSYNSPKYDDRRDSFFSAASRRSAFFSAAGSSYHSVSDSLMGDRDGTVQMYGPASQIPALTTPVPDNWVLIEGDFVLVHASYLSHLGHDCLFAPNAKLSDGIIWLVIVKAGISRGQLLQFLLGLPTGAHLNIPQAEIIPCTAFRIEPSAGFGHMTVDGEAVDYGPIQAELIPAVANILSR